MEGIHSEKREGDRRIKHHEQSEEDPGKKSVAGSKESTETKKVSSRAAGKAAAVMLLKSLATSGTEEPVAGPKAKAKAKAKAKVRARAKAEAKAKATAKAGAKAKAQGTAKGRKGGKAKAEKPKAWSNQAVSLLGCLEIKQMHHLTFSSILRGLAGLIGRSCQERVEPPPTQRELPEEEADTKLGCGCTMLVLLTVLPFSGIVLHGFT